jgi:glycerol kinase
MASHVIALDQGTTSSRAALFDAEGGLVGLASEEFPQLYPRPGWVEHDPEAIWSSQVTAARRVLAETGIDAASVAALGITNQRETTLVWERDTGLPLHNAIVWQCRRTAGRCDALRAAGWAAPLREKTGLVLDAYFSGTKLEWLLDEVPGARERAERGELCFGTVDSFLLWRLTGGRVHATDPSNAARTMLYNLHAGDWDDEILAELRIPRAMLPEVRPSSGLFGESDASFLGRPLPIAGVAGDQQAALFGQACHRPGMAKNTYGTGCFLLVHAGERVPETAAGLLATVAWQTGAAPRAYAVEGSVFIAGAAIQWLRDGLGLIRTAEETAALAASVPDTGGVFFVPAFVGLGAPYWDAYARGTIVGLTRGTTRAHLVRAALEAICLQTCDVAGAVAAGGGPPLAHLRVDGGAAANDFLLQRQADLLGIPVERPRVRETTALGAAFLAGLAVGVWPSLPDVAARWHSERLFEPQIDVAEREETLASWRRAVERARHWASS